MHRPLLLIAPLTVAAIATTLHGQATKAVTATPPAARDTIAEETAVAALDSILREWIAWRAYEFPHLARMLGLPTRPDAIIEYGTAAEGRRVGQLRAFQSDLEAIDVTALDPRSQLDHALLGTVLRQAIEGHACGVHLLPTSLAIEGVGRAFSEAETDLSPERPEDCELYLRRLAWIPQRVSDILELLREGRRRGIVTSRSFMDASLSRPVTGWLKDGLPIDARFATRLGAETGSERAEERNELLAMVNERTIPQIRAALAELDQFLTEIYLPSCRDHETSIAVSPDAQRLNRHLFAVSSGLSEPAEFWLDRAAEELTRLQGEVDAELERNVPFLKEVDTSVLTPAASRAAFLAWINRSTPKTPPAPPAELAGTWHAAARALRPSLPPVDPATPKLEDAQWRRGLLRSAVSISVAMGWEEHVRLYERRDEKSLRTLAERVNSLRRFVIEVGAGTGAWDEARLTELSSGWSAQPAAAGVRSMRASLIGTGITSASTAFDLALRRLRSEFAKAEPPVSERRFYDALFADGPVPLSILEPLLRARLSSPPPTTP